MYVQELCGRRPLRQRYTEDYGKYDNPIFREISEI